MKTQFVRTAKADERSDILELYIYTDALRKLLVDSTKLHSDSDIFVIPSTTDNDSAYIVIDSARNGTSNFFKIAHLGKKPEIASVDTDFERP
jgi:hypothetical protein